MTKTQIIKKIGAIAANVLLYVFIFICILGVILTIVSKKDPDGAATIFGMQMRVVISPSMEKSDATDLTDFEIKDIPLRSMVFIETVPEDKAEADKWFSELKEGDVLTFKYVYVQQETITHRIVNIDENKNGGYTIDLAGDNKETDASVLYQTIDTSLKDSPNYVVGKVVGQNYLLGLLISAVRSVVGLIFIVIIPCFVIVIIEVVKIIKFLGADKRRREEAEKEQQQNELEELKRRIAELEAEKKEAAPDGVAAGGASE